MRTLGLDWSRQNLPDRSSIARLPDTMKSNGADPDSQATGYPVQP